MLALGSGNCYAESKQKNEPYLMTKGPYLPFYFYLTDLLQNS